MKILNRLTGELILEIANLRNADLWNADLRNADLWNADLWNADLRNADLRNADLWNADLRNADLRNADLRNADLQGADFRNADLQGADLQGANINWSSHDLIAEILRQAAKDDYRKRALAGLILVSRDWCWENFKKLKHPQAKWAKEVLMKYKECPL